MEVQRPFPMSPIHLQSILIFLCTVGQLYSAIAIASISTSAFSSHATYATDLFVSTSPSASTGNPDNPIVFVNHHRPDVGKTFASHLSRTLISHGLRLGTIETASVHIAIFSKNYAKSSFCLNELRIMLKSGIPVIPLFYDVNPSDLECHEMYAPVLRMFRWTVVRNGVLYDEDLRMLEEEKAFDAQSCQERPRYDPKTVTEWRKALFDASGLCGFELATYNG